MDILFDPLNISSTVCKEIRQKEKDEELLSSGKGNCRFIISIFKANGFLALLKMFKDFYTTLLLKNTLERSNMSVVLIESFKLPLEVFECCLRLVKEIFCGHFENAYSQYFEHRWSVMSGV